MLKTATKPEILKYGPSLRGPSVKNEGLVFHGTARAIRLINSLFYGKNENIPKICRQFFRKIIFHEISPKSFSQGFLMIFRFSENCPKTHREFPEKQSFTSFAKSIFLSFTTFRNFPLILRQF